ALVARGDLDGRDHVRGRHATRRDGAHGQVRDRGELALVVHGDERHAHRRVLRAPLAPRGGDDRRGVRRDPLLGPTRGVPARLPGVLDRLHTRLPDAAPLRVLPALDSAWMPALTFFVYLAVNWWASWYPGAEPGGGGYVAQRILSTKNERHALLAALWFNIAHYALRPWPWIIVALVSMVLYPGLEDPESGYVK